MVRGGVLAEAKNKNLHVIAESMQLTASVKDLAKEVLADLKADKQAEASASIAGEDGRPKDDPRLNLQYYHLDTLLASGILAWRGERYDAVPCNEDTRIELDEETRLWAAKQVLELSIVSVGEAKSSVSSGAASGTELSPVAS